MLWVSTESDEMVVLPMAPPPGAGERVALGMVAFEDWSVNVTTPVGVPPLAAVMFTVNVTNTWIWRRTRAHRCDDAVFDGLADEITLARGEGIVTAIAGGKDKDGGRRTATK